MIARKVFNENSLQDRISLIHQLQRKEESVEEERAMNPTQVVLCLRVQLICYFVIYASSR